MYKFTCIANGRCYHGVSNEAHQRFQEHMRVSPCQSHVRPDLQLYGHTAFVLDLLHSRLIQAQAHDLDEQYLRVQPPVPHVYYIVHEGRPTRSRRVWAIIRSTSQRRRPL